MKKLRTPLVILLCVLILSAAAGCSRQPVRDQPRPQPRPKSSSIGKSPARKWQMEEVRIEGKYTDAEIVKLDDGRYRIYYTVEPEVPGNQKEMYSSISSDGLNWQQEAGVRMRNRSFPDVVRLPDERWRMYYQSFKIIPGREPEVAIMSSISTDGLSWTEEDGVRIRVGLQGTNDTQRVAAPTVVRLPDDTYFAVYRGRAGENRFGQRDPIDNALKPIDYLISAVSRDGLNWQAGALIVDSDNEELYAQVDGPELVYDGSNLKLYYSSFPGVYIKESKDNGKTWSAEQLILKSTGPEFAPGDSTVIKQKGAWRIYFGLYTRGIFSARLD